MWRARRTAAEQTRVRIGQPSPLGEVRPTVREAEPRQGEPRARLNTHAARNGSPAEPQDLRASSTAPSSFRPVRRTQPRRKPPCACDPPTPEPGPRLRPSSALGSGSHTGSLASATPPPARASRPSVPGHPAPAPRSQLRLSRYSPGLPEPLSSL